MKKLFLLGILFSQACYAQTNGKHYLYSYDSAGNIITRFKTLLRNGQEDDSDNDNTNKDKDSGVRIKTDASWSEVQVEIDGEIRQGDILSIYTSVGFPVATFPIESSRFCLNLSSLKKGIYLFRFNRSGKISESKLFKKN